MSALHTLREKLITIIQQYPLQKNLSTTSLDSASPVERQPEFSSLQEILECCIRDIVKENLPSIPKGAPLVRATEEEDQTDGPVLRFILKTILMLDSFLSESTVPDGDQIKLISTNLIDLLTILNTLYLKSQTSFVNKDEFKLRGFIVADNADDLYSYVADRITRCLSDLFQFENIEVDSIPEIVNEWIMSYKNQFMAAENQRLTLQLAQQAKELERLRQIEAKVDELTLQIEKQRMELESVRAENIVLRTLPVSKNSMLRGCSMWGIVNGSSEVSAPPEQRMGKRF